MRIINTICLCLPIATAFGVSFIPDTEILKFCAAAGAFVIVAGIEFLCTRKINPVMKIGISSGEDVPSQEN